MRSGKDAEIDRAQAEAETVIDVPVVPQEPRTAMAQPQYPHTCSLERNGGLRENGVVQWVPEAQDVPCRFDGDEKTVTLPADITITTHHRVHVKDAEGHTVIGDGRVMAVYPVSASGQAAQLL